MRLLSLVCAACFASMAFAETNLKPWATSGAWEILVDPSNGNGCFMQKDFDDGIRVQFGFEPERDGGFFAALSKNWTQVEAGTSGTVKFITDEAKFAGDVEMIKRDDWLGGWAFFNNPNLAIEVAQRRSLTVIGPKGGTFDINLDGTERAISMMKECQAAQE